MFETFVLNELLLEFGFIKKINSAVLIKHCLKYEDVVSTQEGLDETNNRSEDRHLPNHKEINKIINQIIHGFKEKYKVDLILDEFWTQIHKTGNSTNTRNYLNIENLKESPDISAIYFVKVPKKTGNIIFKFDMDRFREKSQAFLPKEGMVILFPSSLLHYITRNLDKEKRIFLSFNFKIKKNI